MTKQEARHEARLTGRPWESDRARKRRLRREREAAAFRRANGGRTAQLLGAAAAFTARDDYARGRSRVRIDPARGDGKKPTQRERQDACVTYNESAHSLLGY